MSKRILPLLATALTICFITSNGFAQGAPGPKSENNPNQQAQVKTIFSFKNELALTDDQEVKIKALFYDEQTLAEANNNALKTLGAELNKMIDEKDDMRIIKSKLEEISKIQVDVSCRNIEDVRKIGMILSPGQLAKWKDIQRKFASQSKM